MIKILRFVKKWDEEIIYRMSLKDNHVINRIMILSTKLGDKGIVWILMALIFLLFHNKLMFMKISLSIFFSTLIGELIIKHIVGRVRPSNDIDHEELLIKKPKSYSFPSGHTTSSFTAASIMTFSFGWVAAPVCILAVMISLSRIYLRVHYPSDVLAGAFIGVILSVIIDFIFI